MRDYYTGSLTQAERWKVWQDSLGRPMGLYARMRDSAEREHAIREYNETHMQ
jgi:hypothetical protein